MNTIIYTCITGGYDELTEIDTIHRAICFTDMDITSNTWEVVKIKDEPKLNRKIKLCPHLFLPAHTRNVWIDGNALPKNIDKILEGKTGFWCMKHPKRKCAYVEGVYCIDIRKDTEENILPQLNKYFSEGFPIDYGLVCGGFLIRDNSEQNREFAEHWWREIENHSTRDQVSFPYVAWKLNFSYNTMPFLGDWFLSRHPKFVKELKSIINKKDFKTADCIIIAGENGSGNSLLMEIFRSLPGTVIVWEPFSPQSGVIPPEYKWGERPYISEDDESTEYKELIAQILTHKKSSDWTLRQCDVYNALQGTRTVVKLIGGQLLLPWLTKNFLFNHRPIHIVRHPIATVSFQIEKSGIDNKSVTSDGMPIWVHNEHYFNHYPFIISLKTKLEQQIAFWCLNNVHVFDKSINEKWLIVCYEDLILNTVSEIERIFNALDLPLDNNICNAINKITNSNADSDLMLSDEQLKKCFSNHELQRIQRIFDYFGLRWYSAFEPFPIKTTIV